MTLVGAHETARDAAERFGKVFRVYRLPAWPPAIYGCTAKELPAEAHVVATYPEAQVAGLKSEASASADAQGSLF